VLHDPLQHVPYGARFDPLTCVILTANYLLLPHLKVEALGIDRNVQYTIFYQCKEFGYSLDSVYRYPEGGGG